MSQCRSCGAELNKPCLDLGLSPVSNHLVKPENLSKEDAQYPLQVKFCEYCYLAQIDDVASREAHFSDDYVYFSSTSSSWLEHAKNYANKVRDKLALTSNSLVVEVASNDGYLLRNFVDWQIPCLAIEPTLSTAKASEELGIENWTEFFGLELANKIVARKGHADLIVANNVLAHVPDVNDFVSGIKRLLKPNGTATIEFPHLLSLIENRLFDTIYHEHYCYFSLLAVNILFERHQLQISDLELLNTHGGSYRLYVQHAGVTTTPEATERVQQALSQEQKAGLTTQLPLEELQQQLNKIKSDFNGWLNTTLAEGKSVIGYGAAAKATTFLNYCNVDSSQIPVILDAAQSKQGRSIPGCRIPIKAPSEISLLKPDYLVIFPWNIKKEIISELGLIKEWGGQFVVALPELRTDKA